MTPDYAIWAEGLLITHRVQPYLVSLRITDEAGMKSDAVEMTLDDRDGKLPLPNTGTSIRVSLGYQETGLIPLGGYHVDEMILASPPQTLTIKGHAADLRQALKSQQTKTWPPQTLGSVIRTIAEEHGYQPRIAESLEGLRLPHMNQTAESDLHFMTRLAQGHGAIAKPSGGYLLFVPKDSHQSVTGKPLPVITVTRDWRMTLAQRPHQGSVVAEYHDMDQAKVREATAGQQAPVHRLRDTFPTQALAERAAHSALKKRTHSTARLNITLVGTPTVFAEGKIALQGFRESIPVYWTVTQVTHAMDRSGFTTQLTAEQTQPKDTL